MYKETSMAAVFQNQTKKLGDKGCVSFKKNGAYQDLSWQEMGYMVRNLAYYLIAEGIKKGETVAIFSGNRHEWWVADQAILSIGAVNVPVYATNSADEARYVLDHSGTSICFAGNLDQLKKIKSFMSRLPNLRMVILFDEDCKDEECIIFKEAIEAGKTMALQDEFEKRLTTIEENDLASILYTSGTTGDPKGVMLSHGNFLANVRQGLKDFLHLVDDNEVYLSMLPLSHALERTCGYYMPVRIGGRVAFAEDFSTVAQNLSEIHPTIFYSVPRLFEKIRAGILAMTADLDGAKKSAFESAMKTAKKNMSYVCLDKKPRPVLGFKVRMAEKLVFSKLKGLLGLDNLKFCISGGSPLSPTDAGFFIGMGLKIYEGYGLTETSPVTNVNRPGEIKPGSVGRPLADTDVKLSDEGEVLIKGPQVMIGYFKNDAATKEVFTEDGFFKTGDIGTIDETGRLSITGRIKDIIVTSGGKNISPQNIEGVLLTSLFIEQIAIIGDNHPFLSALIIPGFDALNKWATDKEINFSNNKDLVANKKVRDMYRLLLDELTGNFSRVEQIRAFKLMEEEWTQNTGELTPTLKVKRKVINDKYASDIQSLYRDN